MGSIILLLAGVCAPVETCTVYINAETGTCIYWVWDSDIERPNPCGEYNEFVPSCRIEEVYTNDDYIRHAAI